jgi:hypothetical protein
MLNPSTADAEQDDPTIRRVLAYTHAWGHKALVVVNLFAWRTPDPGGLLLVDDPVGPQNDNYIRIACFDSPLIVCAWGVNGEIQRRGDAVKTMLRAAGFKLHALRTSKNGKTPYHPLYQAASLVPFEWS